MNEIRLQLALAKAGLASRRHAEELIVAGRVAVNGRVVTELGSKVDPVSDRVTVDGNPVLREAPAYYLMNKPKGYVTTAEDPEGRLTVFSLMKDSPVRLFSVGRLDYNTEGALLLTNDGELAHALMHPSRGVAKVYHAKFRGLIEKEQLAMLRRGVDLPPARPLDKDGKPLPTMRGSDKPERSAPAQVSIINSTGRHSWLQFILHEGKNRQIHRMAEAVGSSLLKLLRVEYAGLSLMDLPVGEYRPLQGREVLEMRQSVGLRPFATQEGPVKPKLKPEPEEDVEPRAGGRRGRDDSDERSSRPGRSAPTRAAGDRPPPGSTSGAPGGTRRSAWDQDRPSPRGSSDRDRPTYGESGRGATAIRPRRPEWSQDRPSARGGEQRERPAFGAAERGAPVRAPRPAWNQDRPSAHDGGEQRERPAFGAAERGAPVRSPRPAWNQDRPNSRDGGERPASGAAERGAPVRAPRPAWNQDRPSAREGSDQRDRPTYGTSGRGTPIRPRRPEWSQDRPVSRDGGEQPAFGASERGAAQVRSPRPAWSPERPSSREGGEQRERPASGAAERGAAPVRSPRPAWSPDRPGGREGSDQRDRPAFGTSGRGSAPLRPRRPEGSPERTSSRDGGEQRERPAFGASDRGPAPGRFSRPALRRDRVNSSEGSDRPARRESAPAGRDALPARPRRPEWSQDRPSSREGSDQRDRPSGSPAGRSGSTTRPHRAAPTRRPDSQLPHDWPPR